MVILRLEIQPVRRGVAQPGSVLAWGASGRRFKSGRPDHTSPISQITSFPQNLFRKVDLFHTFMGPYIEADPKIRGNGAL